MRRTPIKSLSNERRSENRVRAVTFFFFIVGYFMAFSLGHAKGEIHERNREERAERKVMNRTGVIEMRDHRR
jgi:hypothetical protein